jgi:iron complex outermembrane receptor protein
MCTMRSAAVASASPAWSPPLDRIVSFHVGDISLREALDRLAATAHLHLSYSPELLDLNRLVCLSLDSIPVGAVLARLLEDAPVSAVSAGTDHVVLAPSRPVAVATAPVRHPVVLERIVVTGSATGAARKPLPVAIDVVDG